jgi:hypothetical protein
MGEGVPSRPLRRRPLSHGATGFKQVGKLRKINGLQKWLSRTGLRVYAPITLKMLCFFTVEKTMFALGITCLNAVAHGERDRVRGNARFEGFRGSVAAN